MAGFSRSVSAKSAMVSYFLASLIIGTGSWAAAGEMMPANGSKGFLALPPPPEELQRMLDQQKPDAPPASVDPSSAIQLGTAPKIIDMPFILEGGHIIVDVAIGGKAYPFFLDTGAMDTLTRDVAREVGTELRGREQLGGIGPQKVTASSTTIDRIEIGSVALRSVPFIVTDLRNAIVDRGSRPRIAGLIGAEFFSQFAVRIDYGKHSLRLTPHGAFHYEGSGVSLPLTIAMNRSAALVSATIPAGIDGASGDFIIDTGAPGQVLLRSEFMEREGLRSKYPSSIQFLGPGGIGGPLKMAMALGGNVTMETINLTRPLVSFALEARDLSIGKRYAGLIGNGLMRNFVVTIDFGSQHIFLEPTGQTELTRAVFGTGLFVDKPLHNEFEVIDVLHGSDAERAGVKRGDHIVTVEGHPAAELGMADFFALNGDRSRRSMKVEVDGGRSFDLGISQILP